MNYRSAENIPQTHRKYSAIELEVEPQAAQLVPVEEQPVELVEAQIEEPETTVVNNYYVQINQVKKSVRVSGRVGVQAARFLAVPVTAVLIMAAQVLVFIVMLILAIPVEILDNLLSHQRSQKRAAKKAERMEYRREKKGVSGNTKIYVQGDFHAPNSNFNF